MDTKTLRKREWLMVIQLFSGLFLSINLGLYYIFRVFESAILSYKSSIIVGHSFLYSLLIILFFTIILYWYSIAFSWKNLPSHVARLTRLEFINTSIFWSILSIFWWWWGAMIFIEKLIAIYWYWFVPYRLLIVYSIVLLFWIILNYSNINARLKDCNYSEHFVWFYLIPWINTLFHIFLSLKSGTIGENRYWPDPLQVSETVLSWPKDTKGPESKTNSLVK
jgi:hypothetical protein